MMQGPGGGGLKGPTQVEEGRPFDIEVAVEGVDHVLVSDGSPGSKPQEFPVGPGGKVTIPASSQWQAGTVLFIYTNTVPVKGIQVEVVPAQFSWWKP